MSETPGLTAERLAWARTTIKLLIGTGAGWKASKDRDTLLSALLDAAEENVRLREQLASIEATAENFVLKVGASELSIEEVNRNLQTIANSFKEKYGTYEAACEALETLTGADLFLHELLMDKFSCLKVTRDALAQLAEWREVAEAVAVDWEHPLQIRNDVAYIRNLMEKYPKGGE